MAKAILGKLIQGKHLEFDEMREAMEQIMEGQWTGAQIGSFLTALRMKGETEEEIAAAVATLREKSTVVPTQRRPLVDTCGTGGDHSNTFNISTVSALVAAGAGVAIAKHGNKAVSSACGSANVLQELGVNLELSPEEVGHCIDEVGIGFLFAPKLHGAMRHVIGPRQEIGQRTLFNLLGPMINPARARRQVIGVYDLKLTRTVAEVLKRLGTDHVLVVAGTDGLDEITLTAPSKVAELKDGKVTEFILNPQDLGFSLCRKEDIVGGDAGQNAAIARDILSGAKSARRDIVLLNSAAAIYVSGQAASLKDGLALAAKAIDSGSATAVLEKLAAFTARAGAAAA